MPRDTFSSRLDEQSDTVYLQYLRKPEYELMEEHFYHPLCLLNRSHVIALTETDLLSLDDAAEIFRVLEEIETSEPHSLGDYDAFEDVYFAMEQHVISSLGESIGGKIHTGRSRNDLFAAAVRIIVRETLLEILDAICELRETVLGRASETSDVVMTAYTHSQPAQPITLGHYLLAFDHVLSRDFERLMHSYRNCNQSPLGAAAIGGTGFPLDRNRLAELAGFTDVCINTYDAVSSADYIPQVANDLALLLTTISRVSRDLVDWGTVEFDYVELDESYATVSSIMPQKKNPVVLEKTRTVASDAIGSANSAMVHMKGAPYGDVREISKYTYMPLLESSSDVYRSLRLFAGVIETMEINEETMRTNADENFSTVTELADTLVRETDLSFRNAHEVVGHLVNTMYADGKTATDITLSDLQASAREMLGRSIQLSESELDASLDPVTNVERRNVLGGTAPEEVAADLDRQLQLLSSQRDWLSEMESTLETARTSRRQAITNILDENDS